MRGFTVFFAVLVSSLALAIGFAIYDLVTRELLLSQTTTQSQHAIFAADAGAECALYWDSKYGGSGSAFSTSTASIQPTSGIRCGNADVATSWVVTETPTSGTTVFTLTLGTSAAAPCATVTVIKTGNPAQTSISSRGRNTCASSGVVRVERALQVSY